MYPQQQQYQPFYQPQMQSYQQYEQFSEYHPASSQMKEDQKTNEFEATTFKRFEDFKPFADPIAQVKSAQPIQFNVNAPVFVLKKPDDVLTIKLREEFKVPEEHIKPLKELLEKIKATKNDLKTHFQSLIDLRKTYLCTSIKPSESTFWQGQIERFKNIEESKKFIEESKKAH